jgi:hypothetical protein
MSSSKRSAALIGLLAAAIGLAARDAAASPVDNGEADGSTTWEVDTVVTGGARVYWTSGQTSFFGIDGGYVTGTLDHAGAFTGDTGYSFPAVGTGQYIGATQILAQLNVRNVAGTFNASVPNYGTIGLTMDVRVHFTGPVNCSTGWASSVTVSGTNYHYNSGYFDATSGAFTFPAFTSGACGGNGTTLNNDFSLGTSGASISWANGLINNPAILVGSP